MKAAEDSQSPRTNRIITFYSYKGGVGRSMALANVAAVLAQLGRRVLVIDFDLEAPGIERYFDQPGLLERKADPKWEVVPGFVDMLIGIRDGGPIDWRQCITEFNGPYLAAPIHLIRAGSDHGNYAAKAQSLNWEKLFTEHGLGDHLARLRMEWSEAYDLVLIDSRTGVSDIGGICTILLPDALIMLFTANRQSIDGTIAVARLARQAQERLPVERARLQVVPLLSRDDRRTEYEQSERWRGIVAEAMGDFFSEWVSEGVSPLRVLSRLYLPQIAFWSFGERLPVIERPAELDDPGTLGAAYSLLAKLVDLDLNWRAIDDESKMGLPASEIVPPTALSPPESESARGDTNFAGPGEWPGGSFPTLPSTLRTSGFATLKGLSRPFFIAGIVGLAAVAVMIWRHSPQDAAIPVASEAAPATPSMTIDQAQAMISSPQTMAEQRIDALNFLVGSGAVPRGAILDGLSLADKVPRLAGCVDCALAGATLTGVTFDKGIFTGSNFVGAKLSGASFVGATLENVDLSDADLDGVIFSGAQFKRTTITGARIDRDQLTAEQVKGTIGTPDWTKPIVDASPEPRVGTQVIGGNADNGWDVDVFWSEGPASDKNYAQAVRAAEVLVRAANSRQALAPGVLLGRVRIVSLSLARQKTGQFIMGAHYVAEDGGEGEHAAATAIANAVKQRTGAIYSIRSSNGARTQSYISVFACAMK
ncbi:KGGVGR-motif variant AAA ATPase [Sphingobium yanoikuyae]|jgi:uncharacterized protein YjbI with pentapeptide repeats/cellulose biosynthesis protein BcsQ|uniref:CobQ/CobB/MinD/ParA nucleotide binding domain-containing protein n=1 Tax=Sphingobium yanoikuyae TaxID=13690 RepID=A0A430BS32_SPHYA|nr:pentapeptide repeat-containing protein [Sphingobium yanoikuyae]RSU55548.1 hypothetical protein DAH51_16585 [Sphingobium yanoikuyae]